MSLSDDQRKALRKSFVRFLATIRNLRRQLEPHHLPRLTPLHLRGPYWPRLLPGCWGVTFGDPAWAARWRPVKDWSANAWIG